MSSASNAEYYATLLNDMDLLGEAVEIGVFRGKFSAAFLAHWKGHLLHLVDPWHAPPNAQGMKGTTKELDEAIAAVKQHANRVKFHVATSADAAEDIQDSSLDFVYVDGDHRYPGVLADLLTYWPKLRIGGVLAGHDYRSNCGVPRAVREFCKERNLQHHVLPELDCPKPNALWHIIKETN